MSKTDKIVLINESRRAWSFPALPMPHVELVTRPNSERKKIPPKIVGKTAGGELMYSSVELESVQRFKPPILEAASLAQDGTIDDTKPAPRIEVPRWYLDELLKIKGLKSVFGRKRDGIAVGRTRAEAAIDALSDERGRHAEIEAELTRTQEALSRARTQLGRVDDVEEELRKTRAELAKVSKASKLDPKEVERVMAENAKLKADLETATAPRK